MNPKADPDLFALSAPSDADRTEVTEQAPPLVAQAGQLPHLTPAGSPHLADFVLLRELGRGSFARVYLAHQKSLDRKVALKVTHLPARNEGQTLAGLEHDHIVKVYAEFNDPVSDQRGLVLQYVPGTNFGHVLRELFQDGRRPQQGREILAAVDQLAKEDVDFDPAALRDRDLFARGDYLATICRLGSRLAEALAFAHARGILHCDIKPANILLNRYGRPMLADFNVSVALKTSTEGTGVGGTLHYMAPEQIAAFREEPGVPIDHRADVYGLALVLLEAISGGLPRFQVVPSDLSRAYLGQRIRPPREWLTQQIQHVPPLVWRVLERCLDPDPGKRFASAQDLAGALNHAADLLETQRRLPPEGRLSRLARTRPLTTLIVLTLVPHLVGSLVNIAYNTGQIPLDRPQQAAFGTLILIYNAVIYPLCTALAIWMLRPLMRATPGKLEAASREEMDGLRRRALALGRWGLVLALLGWLPGCLFFPLALNMMAGPVAGEIFGHFAASFALSCLIALTYSYFGIQFVVLRGFYPRLVHAEQTPQEISAELTGLVRGLGWLQVLAALVPLAGAALLLVLAPAEFNLASRLLVTALIIAGMIGLGVAVLVANYLRDVAQGFQSQAAASGLLPGP